MKSEEFSFKSAFGEVLPMTPELGASLDAINTLQREKLEQITVMREPHVLSVYKENQTHSPNELVECKLTDNRALLDESGEMIMNPDKPIILAPGYKDRNYLSMAEWLTEQGIWAVVPHVQHEYNNILKNEKALLGKLPTEESKEWAIAYELSGAPIVAAREYIAEEYGISDEEPVTVIGISLGVNNTLCAINMGVKGFGDIYAVAPFLGKENFATPSLEDIYSIAPFLKNSRAAETQPGPWSVIGRFAATGPRNVAFRSTPEQIPGLMQDTVSSLGAITDLRKGLFHICVRAGIAEDTHATITRHVAEGHTVHFLTSHKDSFAPTDIISNHFSDIDGVEVVEKSFDYHPTTTSREGRAVIKGVAHAIGEREQRKKLALSA
jgi:hypothetical protein